MNGVIVTVQDGPESFQYVYQQRDDDREDQEAWADLLRVLTEKHGPADGGRHAAHRLYIRVAPGDKSAGYVADPYEMEHNRPECEETLTDPNKCQQFHTGPSL